MKYIRHYFRSLHHYIENFGNKEIRFVYFSLLSAIGHIFCRSKIVLPITFPKKSEHCFKFLRQGEIESSLTLAEKCADIFHKNKVIKNPSDRKYRYLNPIEISYEDPEFLSSLTKVVLDEKVIHFVTNRLGQRPFIRSIFFLYSPNKHFVDDWNSSQKWHVDHEDITQVKLFLAVTEIDENSGPLTFMNEKTSKQTMRRKDYFPRSTISESLIRHCLYTFTAARGDILLIDTSSCLHYGSRPGDRYRLLFGIQFCRRTSCLLNEEIINSNNGVRKLNKMLERYFVDE